MYDEYIHREILNLTVRQALTRGYSVYKKHMKGNKKNRIQEITWIEAERLFWRNKE